MLLEQALFTSAQTKQNRGYHLVARSPGVADPTAQTLSVWGPTHDSLLSKSTTCESLNYFLADDDWGVLSRTVYGESEYSSRGGFRVETNLILVRRNQLSGYAFNPLTLGRMALALGHLRLRPTSPAVLEPIEFPQSCLAADASHGDADSATIELSARIRKTVRDHRVMVIAADNPLAIIANVLTGLPDRDRASLSFSTGLKPSLHRRFDLQFLPEVEKRTRYDLKASGIVCIDAPVAKAERG